MLVVLLLILAVILALGMSFFASQNPARVDVAIANMRWTGVPLYLIVLLSLLSGLLIAWVFGLISSISSSITLFGKDIKIRNTSREVGGLSKRVKELEAENSRLKNKIPIRERILPKPA